MGHMMRLMRYIHSFFLPFARLNWVFNPPENITDAAGNVIGIEFRLSQVDLRDLLRRDWKI